MLSALSPTLFVFDPLLIEGEGGGGSEECDSVGGSRLCAAGGLASHRIDF